MISALLVRLLQTVFAVWGIASVVFLLSRQLPMGAGQLALADSADLAGNLMTPGAQQLARQAAEQRFGLDLPVFYASRMAAPAGQESTWRWHGSHNQYHQWLSQLVRGNLGISFRNGQAVGALLQAALAYTIPLTGTAALLALVLAIRLALGLAAASWWQSTVSAILVSLHALPLFIIALALLLLFANPEVLAWFPAYGLGEDSDLVVGTWDYVGTFAAHLALPVFCLTISAVPDLTLQLSAALRHELGAGYIVTARGKGLPEKLILRKHALRNALLPTLTQFTNLLPALVGGAVVVEVVFALPGMGRLLAQAATTRDYPVLVGGVLLTGAARVLALLVADLLYLWADPRMRWQR